jgi:hypothetical protein
MAGCFAPPRALRSYAKFDATGMFELTRFRFPSPPSGDADFRGRFLKARQYASPQTTRSVTRTSHVRLLIL